MGELILRFGMYLSGMAEPLDWPEFGKMSERELRELIEWIRATLVHAEDAQDALLDIADTLRVDMRT